MKGKFAGTRAQFLMTHIFSQRVANGASIDVSCLFVAQAVPENELFLSKMSLF